MMKVFLLTVQVLLVLIFFQIGEVAMGSKADVEHEQIPPDEFKRMENDHEAVIKTAFLELTSTSENKRRLAAIKLRHLSLRDAGIRYSVSEKEIHTLIKQIEIEKNLAAQVAEVSTLSEVYHHASGTSEKSTIADTLKKIGVGKYAREVILEAHYQNHFLEKTVEPKDYIVFEKMGLKNSDFVTVDTLFGHTVYDFTRLNTAALKEKSDAITKALGPVLVPKTEAIILLEALDVANQIGNHGSPLFSEIANLTEHEFWRVRKLSFEILFRAKKLELLSVERKKKLNSDPIPEVQVKVQSFGLE